MPHLYVKSLSPRFNTTSAGAEITVPSTATFASMFMMVGYAGCYVGGLPSCAIDV